MKRRDVLALSAAAVAAPSVIRAQGARSVLRFVPQSDLALLDPVFDTALVTRNHAMMIYDQLYGLDETYQPRLQLVEGHVIEDDGRI